MQDLGISMTFLNGPAYPKQESNTKEADNLISLAN
jgi:hypothetical protein